MINEVSGDILLTKAQALVHSIASNDPFEQGLARALRAQQGCEYEHTRRCPFGQGLARTLRAQWPAIHADYHHYASQKQLNPGVLWGWGTQEIRVYTLATREVDFRHGARPGGATVEYVTQCLHQLRHELEQEQITSLALPRLATGGGRLEWEDVMPLIEKHLGNVPIPIYLYTAYKPGVQADEPGL